MNLIISLLIITSFLLPSQDAKKEQMLCKKWHQIGSKSFGKPYKELNGCMGEQIEFRQDGSFSKTVYCTLNFAGQWRFNSDSTKLNIALTEMDGKHVDKTMNIEQTKPTTIILFLSNDSLILGKEVYYGKDRKYGHDDSYYINYPNHY